MKAQVKFTVQPGWQDPNTLSKSRRLGKINQNEIKTIPMPAPAIIVLELHTEHTDLSPLEDTVLWQGATRPGKRHLLRSRNLEILSSFPGVHAT
jgi:hypothetical protein